MKPSTVKDLIEYLSKFDQSLPVAYQVFSESCLLELEDIKIEELCEHRPDGWVADKRPDKPYIEYVLFPGN